jgi:hypothetical protein
MRLATQCYLHCNLPASPRFAKTLPRMTGISLEQKGTKETKEEYFFVAFVCFCRNRFPMGGIDGEFLIRRRGQPSVAA